MTKQQTAVVTWCCGHLDVLQRTLPAAARLWRTWLVDYSDPQGAGAWVRDQLRSGALEHVTVVRAQAFADTSRRPIQSQARAWQAGIDRLPVGVRRVLLLDPLSLVTDATVAAVEAAGLDEVLYQGDSLLAVPAALLVEHRLCPAYVGSGVEAADLRARLACHGHGVTVRQADLGVRVLARPLPPPLAAVRLLAHRAGLLGLAEGPARATLGRLAGPGG